jgi:hypothetical protein
MCCVFNSKQSLCEIIISPFPGLRKSSEKSQIGIIIKWFATEIIFLPSHTLRLLFVCSYKKGPQFSHRGEYSKFQQLTATIIRRILHDLIKRCQNSQTFIFCGEIFEEIVLNKLHKYETFMGHG